MKLMSQNILPEISMNLELQQGKIFLIILFVIVTMEE